MNDLPPPRFLRSRVAPWFVLLSGLAGVIGSVVAGFQAANEAAVARRIDESTLSQLFEKQQAFKDMKTGLSTLKQDVEFSKKGFLDLVKRPLPTDTPSQVRTRIEEIGVLVQRIDDRSEALDQRMARLEQTVVDSPEKAVAIPMLRRDLQSAERRIEDRFADAKANTDRFYDLIILLIGLMGTISVTVLGAAAVEVFKRRGS